MTAFGAALAVELGASADPTLVRPYHPLRVLPKENFQSPNLRYSAAKCLLHRPHGNTGHRRSRSAPSGLISDQHHRGLRTSQSHRMIYRHHARQGLPSPVVHPASRSMTSPSPSLTVMVRPAADATTTRDGRCGSKVDPSSAHVALGISCVQMRHGHRSDRNPCTRASQPVHSTHACTVHPHLRTYMYM
jgi:hypothetical protein